MLDSPFSCDCGSSPLRLARPGLHSGKRNRGGAFFLASQQVSESAGRLGLPGLRGGTSDTRSGMDIYGHAFWGRLWILMDIFMDVRPEIRGQGSEGRLGGGRAVSQASEANPHPSDEDLSLPPQEAKTASWGPRMLGTPGAGAPGGCCVP